MKRLVCLIVMSIFFNTGIQAQNLPAPEYINYSSVINVIADFVKASDTVLWKRSMNSLRASADSLKEDMPMPGINVQMGTTKKPLTDEQIYNERKKSVNVIGRLRRISGTNVNLDILGTGFFISKQGHCITNRHVLQDLLKQKTADEDLVYFIITENKQVYVLDKLFGYSVNNDLAVFSIISTGKEFDPISIGRPAVVGAPVYCISHPAGELYYFSKGIVARNLSRDSTTLGTMYSQAGKTPIRMEITADYGGGSSGGPVMDKFGNLTGIIATTNTIFLHGENGAGTMHPQMVIKSTIPVKALTDLLK